MRDEQLILLRPALDLETSQSTPGELFQNQTLRPILKLQHPLLVQIFQSYIHKRKDGYFSLSKKGRLDWIAHTVRTDQRFRNLLLGTIIGHFAETELTDFLENEADYTRRLANMLIQRLQSVVFVENTYTS